MWNCGRSESFLEGKTHVKVGMQELQRSEDFAYGDCVCRVDGDWDFGGYWCVRCAERHRLLGALEHGNVTGEPPVEYTKTGRTMYIDDLVIQGTVYFEP